MPLAVVYSRASFGIDAPLITIEVHISLGMPSLTIVGLPETAVKESKDRVRSALLNSGFDFPPRRITINLAPADLPKKEGGRFDLPIALGILIASEQLAAIDVEKYEFAGELALDGTLRGFEGALPFAIATRKTNKALIVPEENSLEAALPHGVVILPAKNLIAVCAHLTMAITIQPFHLQLPPPINIADLDIAEIRGQHLAKRALTIAAAGQHNLLFTGPPGTGKTMLASRLITILPALSEEEALETAAIYSVCGKKFCAELWRQRPLRTPHHTASGVALVGGSSPPRPGEISLAHNGVLFLDELPEFSRHVLEAMREPLESGVVTISRAAQQAKFPARFQLVAAMNPCPCGHYGDSRFNCSCTRDQVSRYQSRLSGPLLDRIDMYVAVPPLPKNILLHDITPTETSDELRHKVIAARTLQLQRSGKINAQLNNKNIGQVCKLVKSDQEYLETAIEKLNFSARGIHHVLKLARTIADLAGIAEIQHEHLAEALGYRKLW